VNVAGILVRGIKGDVKTIHRFIAAAYGKVIPWGYKKKPVAEDVFPVPVMHKGTGIFFQEKKQLIMGPVGGYAVYKPGVLKTVAADRPDMFDHISML
jgi:hypothetical protein